MSMQDALMVWGILCLVLIIVEASIRSWKTRHTFSEYGQKPPMEYWDKFFHTGWSKEVAKTRYAVHILRKGG